MSYQPQGQKTAAACSSSEAKITQTVEQTTVVAQEQHGEEHKGFMANIKDKVEHVDKKKAAIGAAVGLAAIGAAVAGGVAYKHHQDKKHAEAEAAAAHSKVETTESTTTTTTVTTSATTAVYNSYQVTTGQSDNKIRFGNKIVLKHNQTGRFLSFCDSHLASKASSQKYIYAGGWNKTEKEYFQILPGSKGGNAGQVIAIGSVVRLRHIKTGNMLHSHDHKSCHTTSQNEVTGYSATDDNDDWIVESWSQNCNELTAETKIRLVHAKTKTALYSHEVKATGYSGDAVEVVSSTSTKEENASWTISF